MRSDAGPVPGAARAADECRGQQPVPVPFGSSSLRPLAHELAGTGTCCHSWPGLSRVGTAALANNVEVPWPRKVGTGVVRAFACECVLLFEVKAKWGQARRASPRSCKRRRRKSVTGSECQSPYSSPSLRPLAHGQAGTGAVRAFACECVLIFAVRAKRGQAPPAPVPGAARAADENR